MRTTALRGSPIVRWPRRVAFSATFLCHLPGPGPSMHRWLVCVAFSAPNPRHLTGPALHAVVRPGGPAEDARRASARPAWLHSSIERPTSIDVARCAGVSQSTVSLVFSGKGRGRVSEATQERVRRCARELGYRPNAAAQALRLGSSRAVALLVPDMTNPFFSRVLRGAQRAAAEAGYIVILVDTRNDRHWESQSFEAPRAGPVDGYMLFDGTAPDAPGPDRSAEHTSELQSPC